MARDLGSRITVTGTLVALDALHVGSGWEDPESDMTLAVDGQGRLYAPGSSLAGALRAWCRRALGANAADDLFGFQIRGDEAETGHASRLCIEDAPVVHTNGRRPVEIRDGVGIDRAWGVAAPKIKFDRAVLQPGTGLKLQLSLDLPTDLEAANSLKSHLGFLLSDLQAGRIRLGAARTRGLGRVKLKDLNWTEQTQDRAGLIQALRKDQAPQASPELLCQANPKATRPTLPTLRVFIDWAPVLPTFVKAGVDGLRVDIIPLLGGQNAADYAPLIPGSSLKGVLRSHAERILRTVLCRDVPGQAGKPGRQQFLDQMDDNLPLIDWLFGATKGQKKSGKLGALCVADCFAREPKPLDAWNALLFQAPLADDAAEAGHDHKQLMQSFPASLAKANRHQWQKAFHVAIDRWTGGSAESMLYQVLEPHGETWPPFELELDLNPPHSRAGSALDREQQLHASLALLLLTLRDLAERRIPIGFGGNRGLGSVQVSRITLLPQKAGDVFPGLAAKTVLNQGSLDGLGPELQANLRRAWQNILENAKTAGAPV